MRDRFTSRMMSVGAALGVALGGGAIAVATVGPDDLPEQASDAAGAAVAAAGQQEEPEEIEDLDEVEEALEVEESTEADPDAFGAWVSELPKGLGCLHGKLVSHIASNGLHQEGVESLPDFTGFEGEDARAAVMAYLELDEAPHCVEGGPPEHAGRPDETGRPDNPGPPEHANAPADAGRPSDAGPPATD